MRRDTRTLHPYAGMRTAGGRLACRGRVRAQPEVGARLACRVLHDGLRPCSPRVVHDGVIDATGQELGARLGGGCGLAAAGTVGEPSGDRRGRGEAGP